MSCILPTFDIHVTLSTSLDKTAPSPGKKNGRRKCYCVNRDNPHFSQFRRHAKGLGPVRYQTISVHEVHEFGTSPLRYQSCRVRYIAVSLVPLRYITEVTSSVPKKTIPSNFNVLKFLYNVILHRGLYTLCLKKTSPMFLAITRESIVGFAIA